MGGRKGAGVDKRHLLHSFIYYVPETGNSKMSRVPIFEEQTKTVPIFDNLMKIKSTLANVLLGAEFLSMNKIKHS